MASYKQRAGGDSGCPERVRPGHFESRDILHVGTDKAEYNLLASSGLRHVAVITMTFAGTKDEPVDNVSVLGRGKYLRGYLAGVTPVITL